MASEALISLVVDYLIPYAQEKVTLVSSAREQVGKLAVTLKFIQKVLADAEQKQVTDAAVMDWLVKLKGVVYAAEDVLDEWNTKTALLTHETGDVDSAGSTRKKVLSILLSICLCFKDVSVRYDIGGQIKELRERLDEIAEEKGKYALVASDSHHDLHPSVTPLTTSAVNVSDILGRDRDKKIIINFLLGDSSSQGHVPVQVISIVGTGGFGKTTLARLVFKDKNVENAFDCKIWVCVSQPFDQVRIAKEIIEQIPPKNVPTFHGLEVLHQHLSNAVKEKKFLLILDDVWTSDDRDWEPLKLCLSGGASGSRIVVTTRSREVAMMMGSAHIHDLRILSEEDSWSLLSHVALRGREDEHRKFEKIGREIAFKCKGVPLAIKTLASLLCHKRNIKEWRDVANNNLWEMPKIKEFFLPSLFISYYSLSPVSKQCFLFCSVFPKDTTLWKSKLIGLWMANGFFGYQGNRELEKIGEHHFDTLVMCSFFQDFGRGLDESIICCQMHDLVHDFAQFLSQGECVIEDGNNGEFDASRVRHLWTRNFSDELYNANNLRTVMGLGSDIVPHIGKLVCLRTLDLSKGVFEELPSAVCKLMHLRYLDLSSNIRISELPEEICNLYNLQTLRLSFCSLRKLPERMGDLCNLRVLDIDYTDLNGLPVGFRKLIFLQRLSTFIVGELNTECKIGDLRYLNKLQGSLRIEGLERIKDANEADEAELNKRDDIDDLTLKFTYGRTAETSNSVLQRLEPSESLKSLKIVSYPGDQFPGWMYDSTLLSSLVTINLNYCVNCTELPPMGKLESLQRLVLRNLRSVKRLGPEFFGGEDGVVSFPKMMNFIIYGMSELEEWNFLQGDVSTTTRIMPNLRNLDISSCPKLTYLPYYMFQPKLDILLLDDCESLDFDLKDLQQNVTLRELRIDNCPHLEQRFQGEKWRSILSHVPIIKLNDAEIKRSD